ncbi:glycosyltransferase [Argonema antarcticum]|uniref:glycosyltransferase n=1 Tax=Argonema antarcticum TaxID=2942763 RepID=UPI0020126E80|nr:glycosyltransferase [Argonema antarcticum]MCL1471489.1 glycosyltransferase [Argonema antarcticum A004/B2]
MPLISVVIPVYNGEKTVRETSESVLSQTFKDFELIVINDGSTDKTIEIISRIQDERLKVFSYPNAGLAASRNRGISLAKGEYISFIDADDMWTPDKLEGQLKALQENPQAAVAYSWSDCIDESSKNFRSGTYLTFNGDVYENLLLTNFVDNGSNALIRKEVFSEVGGFDESLKSGEDWDMWLRLAAKYHFVAVSKPQILYRITASSMSANLVRMEAETMQVIAQAFDRAPASLQYLKPLTKGNIYKYLLFKALDLTPSRKRGLEGVRFLWYAVKYDPALLRRRVIWKILLRILVVTVLPSKQAEVLFNKLERAADITTIFIHSRREP